MSNNFHRTNINEGVSKTGGGEELIDLDCATLNIQRCGLRSLKEKIKYGFKKRVSHQKVR